MEERIQDIVEQWFLLEPVLFQIWCHHHVVPNNQLTCAVRSGKGRIEYNPEWLKDLSKIQLELLLRSELIRILLKHPYERLPENCQADVIAMASDCVLTSYYPQLKKLEGMCTTDNLELPEKEAYEWYAHHIALSQQNGDSDAESSSSGEGNGESKGNGKGDGDGNGESKANGDGDGNDSKAKAEQSEMWEEDQLQQQQINEIIQTTTQWGSISGKLREQIIASTKPKIDYRYAFSGFRSSIVSSKRHLTRMRPNRRMEFEQMGSVYQLSTRLLVAVDVSGSVNSLQLDYFYSLIRRYFKYGIEQMDVVQFDAALGEVRPFKQRTTTIEVLGRGGTSFQPIIDYVKEHAYDGLCIMTDGDAPAPTIPIGFHTPLLWVMSSEKEYQDSHHWMEHLPHSRACWLQL